MTEKPLIKIAVVGPESSGKSTITQALAKHFNASWVPEYSRFYCANLSRDCTIQDEVNIFHGQVALESAIETVSKGDFLFCDTTILTVKIWCDHLFGETPNNVLQSLKSKHYDFYLLLKNDLPWEDDPLRDFKGMGDYFFEVWEKELQALNANYVVVGGIENREGNAIKAVELFLSSK